MENGQKTAAQKAQATRKANAEKRKEKMQLIDTLNKIIIDGCLLILEDTNSSPGDRIEALKILRTMI